MPAIKILLFLLLFASPVIAQWNDGYLPEVGEPGVIDTIYGSRHLQSLGAGMLNVGPRPGESYGRVWFTGFDAGPATIGRSQYYEIQGGPNLNFKEILKSAQPTGMDLQYYSDFAPIASRGSRDRLHLGRANIPTVYWQDEQGNYDTSKTTELLTEHLPSLEYFDSYGNLVYHAFLTSDSVQDIVSIVIRGYNNGKPDSLFAVLYKGSVDLKGKRQAFPSEMIFMGIYDPLIGWSRTSAQGDWRGTGREDLITADSRAKAYFHYRNQGNFSLADFARSLTEDTLVSITDLNGFEIGQTVGKLNNALTMRAFPRKEDDRSSDLIFGAYKEGHETSLYFFRGHQDFGKHRLTFDSAGLTIKTPSSKFSGFGFGNSLRDLGDMTGTGNRVFYAGISQSSGFRAWHLFYVMGDAMDDTADMAYLVEPYGRAWVDTITANGDNLQDVILGIPEYYSDKDLEKGKTWVGTIHLLYGNKNIPVKGRSSVDDQSPHLPLAVYPNPTNGPTTIRLSDLNARSIELSILDLLGRQVQHRTYPTMARMQEMTLDLSVLEAGVYFLQITSGDRSVRTSLRILPH